MQPRRIEVVPYDPAWKTVFERIKAMLLGHIGDLVLSIEHVGRGIFAKMLCHQGYITRKLGT